MIKLTPIQDKAVDLILKKPEVLLEGGSRSGKTFLIVYLILLRMMKYPGTRHVSVRRAFAHAKVSLWYQTIPDVAQMMGLAYKENKTDWFIEIENGSTYWIGGLDDKERIEKVLGNEYATIHINELSQTTYDAYETLKTRLNPPQGVRGLFLSDYNPPSTHHFGYEVFHKNIDPITKQPLEQEALDDIGYLQMNPIDNITNLSENYMKTLSSLSEAKQKRFKYGKYSDGSANALWKMENIMANRVPINHIEQFSRIVVAVDPAVSNNITSDETGIIIIGEYLNHYYVLGDETLKDSVTKWGQEVCSIFSSYRANNVVAEVNQGGDLVTANIKNYNRNIPVVTVHATRGKAIRAEPVAELYYQGRVHHVGGFPDLEEELTTWEPTGNSKSPNRLDALVWGINYLSGNYSFTGKVKIKGV